MAINKNSNVRGARVFSSRDTVEQRINGGKRNVAGDKKPVVNAGDKKPAPKLPTLKPRDQKVLNDAGVKVEALDTKSIERILKSIENLLLVTQAQIEQNAGSTKPKTVNTNTQPKVTQPNAPVEQFVRTVGALGKVWREGCYADNKEDFKDALVKAKSYGVALSMFGKTIVDKKFGQMAIYGVTVRAGVCKLKCVTLKGREVAVDASEFIAF